MPFITQLSEETKVDEKNWLIEIYMEMAVKMAVGRDCCTFGEKRAPTLVCRDIHQGALLLTVK